MLIPTLVLLACLSPPGGPLFPQEASSRHASSRQPARPATTWVARQDTTVRASAPRAAQSGAAAGLSGARAGLGPAPAPPVLHTFGFGFGYLPGPGLRLFGLYQYRGLEPGVLALTAGWNEQLFGSVEYAVSFPLGFAEREQISLLAGLFSNFEANRLLDGSETDERRTGGRLRLEWTTSPGAAFLSAFLQGQYTRIHLLRGEAPDETTPLTLLDLGALFVWRPDPLGEGLRLAPRLRIGLDWPLEANFASFATTGSYREQLWRPLEFVIEGWAELVSPGTPAFERAAFGSLLSVRGFRRDDVMGRFLWILQNELWTPVPGLAGAEAGLGALVDRYVRLAGFADLGGAYLTADAAPGLRAGFGLGLRLLLGAATLRLDWAYGVGEAATDSDSGRLYFNIGATLQ